VNILEQLGLWHAFPLVTLVGYPLDTLSSRKRFWDNPLLDIRGKSVVEGRSSYLYYIKSKRNIHTHTQEGKKRNLEASDHPIISGERVGSLYIANARDACARDRQEKKCTHQLYSVNKVFEI